MASLARTPGHSILHDQHFPLREEDKSFTIVLIGHISTKLQWYPPNYWWHYYIVLLLNWTTVIQYSVTVQ